MSRLSKIGIEVVNSGLAMILALGLESTTTAQANDCHPPTPCPCAADGMCYPKRETWGNYQTRWRPWPGDQVGVAPTKAEETKSDIREQLPIYQPPRPDQEDLRGPAKRPVAPRATDAAPAEDGPQALPEAGGGLEIELPGLPAIDPQGYSPLKNLKVLPELEDAPPALPLSLSDSLTGTVVDRGLPSQPHIGPTAIANRSRVASVPTADKPVVQVTAEIQSLGGIQLTNPAEQNIYKPTDADLHQAIFIEASDALPGTHQ